MVEKNMSLLEDPNKPLLKLPEVLLLTRRSRSSLSRGVKDGTFPSPVRIGQRAIAWRQEDVADWLRLLKCTSGNIYGW